MKYKIVRKKKAAKGFKDTFNFFMLENIELIGEYEMPYISKYNGPIPNKIINYLRHPQNPGEYFMHFYLYDYAFDGRNGVWYGCQKDNIHFLSMIKRFRKYQGLISTDFSVYIDLPLPAQLWNIYRDRVMCAYLRSLGINVIFNVRWADYRTYEVVFYGIEKHSILAIGSHGLIKHPENRQIFMDGFREMIRRLEPACLIIYGSYTEEMKNLCETKNIKVINFESEQTDARRKIL